MKWRGVLQCTSIYRKLVIIHICVSEKQGKEDRKRAKVLRKHRDRNITNDERKSNVNKLYNFYELHVNVTTVIQAFQHTT